METAFIDEAIELAEKANVSLEPDLLSEPEKKELLERYVRARRVIDFGIASLAGDNPSDLARISGTSIGKAKETVATSKILKESGPLREALKHAEISLDQATEIAKAEESAPGSAEALIQVAKKEQFSVLKDKARRAKLEAEQHKDLFKRQREARSARTYSDDLGMMHVHLAFEPHVGTPLVNRAEAEAQRRYRAAKKNDSQEPFERHLADAYAGLFSGSGKGRARRPELVVLVSHEVAKRGWTDVKDGEVCRIPGVGPVAPPVAKEISEDAFLNGVFYDGKDLRHFKRWTRHIPIEVLLALELGEPPDLDGVKCVDCGNRFRPEFDHIEPHRARGPTSKPNLKPRCDPCHTIKTERDRAVGKFKPPEP